MRLIDADPLYMGIALYLAENAYLNDTALDALKKAAEWVEESPTVDAVPVVHAQWRYKVAYAAHVHVTNIIYCTACGKGFHRIEGTDFNYCPSCGACMDGDPHDGR